MTLDYSIPPFRFLIGSFDATDFLDAIELSLPHFEIAQPLIWTGRFRINYNRKAEKLYPETHFNPLYMPSLWRTGQQQVRLRIRTYDLPVLRIERYAYNEQTRTGEGTLTQILGLAMTDRPAIEPDIEVSQRSMGAAIDALVVAAFEGGYNLVRVPGTAVYGGSPNGTVCSLPTPGRNIAGIGNIVYGGLATRNPIVDAQRLAGVAWQWLNVDNTEIIRTVDGNPNAAPHLFTRTLGEVDWQPDADNINFAASKVIVTGSAQIPAPPDCPKDVPTNPYLDNKGRPKIQKTQEIQPISVIFPSETGNLNPIVSEEKTIAYQYPDDSSLAIPPGLMPVDLLFEVQKNTTPKFSAPYQTVTIYQQPAGRIFSELGSNTTLYTAKIEIQNDLFKSSYVPAGVLDPSLGSNFTLKLEKRETLTTTPVDPALAHGGGIDPQTGKPYCLEPKPQPEQRKSVAQNPLKTVPTRGEAEVAPLGWIPVFNAPYVLDVGFLPQMLANPLAQQIAAREQRRRDAVQITMPIPTEWLAAGCPPLALCTIHDGTFQIDAPIVVLGDGEAKLSFSGGRINRFVVSGGVVDLNNPVALSQALLRSAIESISEIALVIVPAVGVGMAVYSECIAGVIIRLDLIGDSISECITASVSGEILSVESISEVIVSVAPNQVMAISPESVSECMVAAVPGEILSVDSISECITASVSGEILSVESISEAIVSVAPYQVTDISPESVSECMVAAVPGEILSVDSISECITASVSGEILSVESISEAIVSVAPYQVTDISPESVSECMVAAVPGEILSVDSISECTTVSVSGKILSVDSISEAIVSVVP
jgi:hypothetical protein